MSLYPKPPPAWLRFLAGLILFGYGCERWMACGSELGMNHGTAFFTGVAAWALLLSTAPASSRGRDRR